MDSDSEHVCINCNKNLAKKEGKSYRRQSINSTLAKCKTTPVDVLKYNFDIPVTPGRQSFLCLQCTALLKTIDTNQEIVNSKKQKFSEITHESSYVSRKRSSCKGNKEITFKFRRIQHESAQTNTLLETSAMSNARNAWPVKKVILHSY